MLLQLYDYPVFLHNLKYVDLNEMKQITLYYYKFIKAPNWYIYGNDAISAVM